jgi:hypothetical protein
MVLTVSMCERSNVRGARMCKKMLVEYVLKSVNTGWMASGLKPPN